MSRILITGTGAVSPYGAGVDTLWAGLCAGRIALSQIDLFDTSPFRNSLGGQVPGYAPVKGRSRALAFALDAASEAVQQAGLTAGTFEPTRAQIILGTNFGGMSAAERALTSDNSDLTEYGFDHQAEKVAQATGFFGGRCVVSLSCASGVAALAVARDVITSGQADIVLALGYDETFALLLCRPKCFACNQQNHDTPVRQQTWWHVVQRRCWRDNN